MSTHFGRRRFLETIAVSGLSAFAPLRQAAAKERVVNDVTQLNPIRVAEERRPRSVDEVREALRAWSGAVSVGGGRFSMGGQIAAPQTLHLDMRGLNKVVSFDPARRVIRVQAGITWRDIQDFI
ncbi:MAG: FAD-binding protein, partial [Burkholderiales bacterium]